MEKKETVIIGSQVFNWQRIGGISRYCVELALALSARGKMNAYLLTGFHNNVHARELIVPGLKQVGVDSPWLHRGRIAMNKLVDATALAMLPDSLYHASFFSPLPQRIKQPLVLTVYDCIHEECPEETDPTGEIAAIKITPVQRADQIICISETTRSSLIKHYDVDPEKCHAIHLGVHLPTVRRERVMSGDYILYVGNRAQCKQPDILYRAFASIRHQLPEWKLLLVGGKALSKPEVEHLEELGIADCVEHKVLSENELEAAYQHAGMMVFPSLYEGFGLPVVEAMACSCPVIVSDGGALPEIAGSAGLVFPVGDYNKLSELILRVATSSELNLKMRRSGYARASEFTWDRCAAKTEQVYHRALESRRSLW